MRTSLVRAALVCASITLTTLASVPANAELPRHHKVVTLRPTLMDRDTEESGLPIFSGFGSAVAIRNGVAFVGIYFGHPESRVGVYAQNAAGTNWVRTATLTVSDPPIAGRNGFGRALVYRDGVAVIASYRILHVFRRVNGVWTDVQQLTPQGGPDDFLELTSMRLENGVLAIGSHSEVTQSAVYLYELGADGKFVKRATLRPSDLPARNQFGADVAVAGNVLVAGDPWQGAAYIFRRRSNGAWVQTQKLAGADTVPLTGTFGSAVAIDRDMILVGAPRFDCVESDVSGGGFCDSSGEGTRGPDGIGAGGAAYGFVPISGQYVQVFKLRPTPDEHANFMDFGRRIVMMGAHVVIDAAEQASEGEFDFRRPNGLSFSYRRDGATVSARARGLTSGYVVTDSIGVANNWLMIGTPLDPNDNACQHELRFCFGEATVFDLNRFAP